MKDKSDIIELIKKCFALSGSPNEYEAARAMAKAQELLEKYNLSQWEIEAASGKITEVAQKYYDILGRFLWRKQLVIHIARANFCQGFMTDISRDKVLVVGRPINIDATFEMVNWILPQIERLSRQATRKYKPVYDDWLDKKVSKQSYRDSFCHGILTRLVRRLYEEREAREKVDENTKALVIHHRQEVKDWVGEHLCLGKSGYNPQPRSVQGYGDGLSAGNKVTLSKPNQVKGG